MKFNNLKKLPPEKRQLILILSIIFAVLLLSWFLLTSFIPFLSSKLKNLTTNEIIATLAVLVGVFSIAFKFIDYILKQQYSSERQILINVEVKDEYAIVTCTLENMGKKRIIPKNVYLFIDEGIENDDYLKFPFCLKHEEGEDDCVLGKRCKGGGINSFPEDLLPEEFKTKYHKSFKLQHLSREAILFIDPGEKFSEDLVLKLNNTGVYRVIAIWTAVNADCICANKQFVLKK